MGTMDTLARGLLMQMQMLTLMLTLTMVAFMVHMAVYMVDMDLVLDMPVAMDMVLELLTIQVVTAMFNSQFKVSMDTTMARGLLNHIVLLVMVWELLDILVMPQALLAEPSMDTHHFIMVRGPQMPNHMVLLVMFMVTVLEL